MANFANPTVGSAYTSFPTEIRDAVTAALQQLSVGSHSNIPTGAIQFSLSDNRWKKYNGSAFVDLTSTYAFNAQISATKLSLGDNQQILLGNSNDFEIIHDGANSVIRETGNGSLFIQSDDIIRLGKTNGTEQYIEASSAQILLKVNNTEKAKVDSSGLFFADNNKARFGDVGDLEIYHDGSNSAIQNSTGVLQLFGGSNQIRLKPQNNEEAIICNPNGNVELFFDNNKKIETLSNGAKITGALNVNSSSLDSHQAVIEGGVAGQSTSSLALKTGSGANSKVADLSFYGTFISPTSDTGQRRMSDITSGFSTGNWGTEYIAFHVGKGASDGNDTQALTDERVRMNKYGIRVSGNSNNPVNPDWDIASAITASGSFGGGIALIDGSAGFIQSLDGLGGNYYLRNATTTSTPEINIKAIANGAVELYFDANKKVETKSYGLLAENADTNILVHNPNNSRGGLVALSTQRVALATTTSGDNIVFGFGSAEPVTSSNFTERFRIENGTGNIQIKNDNAKLQIGADLDLELLHDGNNSIIDEVGTGVLAIRSDTGINILKRTGDHSMIRAIPDGSVELYFAADRVFYTETRGVRLADNTRIFENDAHNTAIIQHADIHHAIILRGSSNADGSTISNTNTTTFREFGNFKFMCGDGTGSTNMSDRLEITSAGINVNGAIFLSSEFNMTGGSDAQRFFDAAVGSSALTFRGTSGGDANHSELARFFRGGGCELNHAGNKKFETTGSGATVTGTLTANAFSGNGSALTGVAPKVVSTQLTSTFTNSDSPTPREQFQTALSLSVTPSSSSVKLLIMISGHINSTSTGNSAADRSNCIFRCFEDSTEIGVEIEKGTDNDHSNIDQMILRTPNSTATKTFHLKIRSSDDDENVSMSAGATLTILEVS